MLNHLCCKVSKECRHNSTAQRIAELEAQAKAEQQAIEKQWTKHLEPFDMKEWYKRTGRSND